MRPRTRQDQARRSANVRALLSGISTRSLRHQRGHSPSHPARAPFHSFSTSCDLRVSPRDNRKPSREQGLRDDERCFARAAIQADEGCCKQHIAARQRAAVFVLAVARVRKGRPVVEGISGRHKARSAYKHARTTIATHRVARSPTSSSGPPILYLPGSSFSPTA